MVTLLSVRDSQAVLHRIVFCNPIRDEYGVRCVFI